MAPVMCVIYVAFAFAVILLNITKVPGVFKMIVTSAFGVNPAFGGIIGSAISWGVKRGIYSNEAGQGSGAIVSAAAECSHPAKQGLVQAFSVYIDTLIVCTSSALIILLSGCYNTVAKDGTTMLAEGIPGVEYGIRWAQNALSKCIGPWAGKALANHYYHVRIYFSYGILLSGRSKYTLSLQREQSSCMGYANSIYFLLLLRCTCKWTDHLDHG